MKLGVTLDILNQKDTPAFYADTLANRPAAGFTGRVFISTDTLDLYRDTGTTWVLLSPSSTGGITGSGAAGQVSYWDSASSITGTNNLFWDSANNRLGVNTNTPTATFDVHGTTNIIAQLNQLTTGQNALLTFQDNSVGKWRLGNIYNAAANDFGIVDILNSLQRFTIKNTGQTFVGTETSSSGLFVVNSATGDNHIVAIGATSPSIRVRNAGTSPTQQFGLGLATTTNNFIQGTTGGEFCIFNSSTTASPILFGIWDAGLSNVQEAAEISSSRNFIVGGGADGGQKLQVVGTSLFSGSVTGTGVTSTYSVTASSAIARSSNITSTLIAAANSDVLVGLDVNPTFTNGAFTAVTNAGIRVGGQMYIGLGKSSVSSNIIIGGVASGRNITSASNATIIGSGSGHSISSATNTTIIGAGSGVALASVSNNTIIGAVSCVSGSGSNNTSVGSGIMGGTVSGGNNTAIGRTALSVLTSGTNNTALGMSSLFSLTTGASNTSVGYEALLGITTPSFNVALGEKAGLKFGTGTSNNILSSGSVFIGYDTRPSASGNNNEIVIAGYIGSGNGATGLGTNTTAIGNSSTTYTALYGNLLLGTTTNGASKLRIVGIPTSSAGLSSGDVYSNAGILTIVP